MVIDAGTVITDERTGHEITAEDGVSAAKGNVVYCTQSTFDSIKDKLN